MSYHMETFTAQQKTHRQSAPDDFDLNNPRHTLSPDALAEDGVVAALLFEADGRNIGRGGGRLRAIMHSRGGSPEWTRVHGDFRHTWCALPDGTQAALLDAERSGRDDDDLGGLTLPEEVARMVPHVAHPYSEAGFTPSQFAESIGGQTRPWLGEDQAAFLWVLNTYKDTHGDPLQVLPPDELRSLPRFTD
ncbi:hypothetical protein [Kocuria rosea]|uniref:hypothetical protein n=1 Tax=Kocuria rosea TaxID=1275 RepID=UPI003019B21C